MVHILIKEWKINNNNNRNITPIRKPETQDAKTSERLQKETEVSFGDYLR